MARPGPERGRGAPPFRPRFTLMIAWLAFFYFLYAFLLALPDLFSLIRHAATLSEPELRARSQAITHAAMQGGRVYMVLAASAVTVGLGAWQRALPGLR